VTDEHPIERRVAGRPWARERETASVDIVEFLTARMDETSGTLAGTLEECDRLGVARDVALLTLAQPFRNHPDFDPAWKASA
jgi:hypothetical protein